MTYKLAEKLIVNVRLRMVYMPFMTESKKKQDAGSQIRNEQDTTASREKPNTQSVIKQNSK
ncbi:MAG: hypothetical protein CML60_01595 [Rhodobacteraceae bacterium]|nr:hypothetical protein [Paracoccaceae bacterium]